MVLEFPSNLIFYDSVITCEEFFCEPVYHTFTLDHMDLTGHKFTDTFLLSVVLVKILLLL